jgi:hypothetical protein
MSEEISNGKLLREIHERVIRLDEWRKTADEKLDELNGIFKQNGICNKARNKLTGLSVRAKIHEGIIIILLIYLVIAKFI